MQISDKTSETTNPDCGVCGAVRTRSFLRVEGRSYYRCDRCMATLLDPAHRISQEKEHTEYREHKNDLADTGYRKFLSKLAEPLLKKLAPNRAGLDYGCGPGPMLAQMLSEAGHQLSLFDPLFFPEQRLLGQRYDFITCSETIEHFHQPAEEFSRFDRMLRPGGWLAIMTCFQTDDSRFATWRYRRDPTHVVFYREDTLHSIAQSLGMSCEIPVKDVALLQKPLKEKQEHAR